MKCTSLQDHHTGGAYSAPRPPSWWEGEHPVARTPFSRPFRPRNRPCGPRALLWPYTGLASMNGEVTYHTIPYHSIPYHAIVLFQATRSIPTIQNKTRRQEITRPTEKNIKTQKTKHTVKQSDRKWTYVHIYTIRSDFTKALLHTLQRATSVILALFIRVSKLGRPVKSSILVTL